MTVTVSFERDALYREVWAAPIVKVAAKYGLSDNGLRKVCRALLVPVPTRGYWAKIAAGQTPPLEPLKPTRGATTYVARPVPPAPSRWHADEDDEWLAERRAFDAQPNHAICVEAVPRRWHRVLESYREELGDWAREMAEARRAQLAYEKAPAWRQRSGQYDKRTPWLWAERHGQVLGDLHRAYPFRVTIDTHRRALALAHAFLIAAERRGFTVEDDPKLGRLVVTGHGGKLYLRIAEKLDTHLRPRRRYDGQIEQQRFRTATGKLRLCLSWGWLARERELVDDSQGLLESKLERALRLVDDLVIRCRHAARERAERDAREAKEERLRALVEARQAARARRAAKERRRRRQLRREAHAWCEAKLIQNYVRERVAHASAPEGCLDPALEAWRHWAIGVAEEMAPAVRL